MKKTRFLSGAKKLFLRKTFFIFNKDRRNGLCTYRSPHKDGEFAAVMNMGDLEADDQAKAEAGDAD